MTEKKRRKRARSEEYERFRAESEARLRRIYERLGARHPPPIGGKDASPEEYRRFRAEADERFHQIYERLRREEAEAEARRQAEQAG